MVKYRLIFGTLMTIAFTGIMIFDAWLDGSLVNQPKPVQATLLCALFVLLAIPAVFEMSVLAKIRKLKLFLPLAMPFTVMLGTVWYWKQFLSLEMAFCAVLLLLSVSVLSIMLYQAIRFGTYKVLKNCSVTLFSILYLGLLCAFLPAIRIEFGIGFFLMHVFTVKSSDIGAYFIGSRFGKHKMIPLISPGKTWEGLGGAILFGTITGVLFSFFCGIISWPAGMVFGILFAVLGQMGDLAESMLKRDALVKDSASLIPGFGGILDVIDSLLATAPLAYVYFRIFGKL